MAGQAMVQRARTIRRLNRFYTKQIGVLTDGLLDSPFSLAEVRVLYELAHRTGPTATELAHALGLDPGYLSRMLREFRRRGLVRGAPAKGDARQSLLSLTAAGRKAFTPLDARANEAVQAMLRGVSVERQRRVVDAMQEIERQLGAEADSSAAERAPYHLRRHRPGDMGWIVHRHGALYHQEYGWDERFEGLVAAIVAEFIERFDPEAGFRLVSEERYHLFGPEMT